MMYQRPPNPYSPVPRRRRPFLLLALSLCIIAVASVTVTVLITHGQIRVGSVNATAPTATGQSVAIAITPMPPPNLPIPPKTDAVPPLGAHFVLPPVTPGQPTATPCPGFTLPTAVLGSPATATTAPTTTPSSSRPTIPVCGNGSLYGPKCYSILPGTNPTQDEIRQKLYTVANTRGVSFSLVEAIAWQESGWQENVQACDGGVGVMQLQPETSVWLNKQFNTNYSSFELDGNINLGVTMVTWLYNYYIPFCNQGLTSGTCNWDTVWPGATDGATIRQIVLSAYNEGVGTMAHYGIQNWSYVNSVSLLWKQFKASES